MEITCTLPRLFPKKCVTVTRPMFNQSRFFVRVYDEPWTRSWIGWIQGFLGFLNSVTETLIWRAQIVEVQKSFEIIPNYNQFPGNLTSKTDFYIDKSSTWKVMSIPNPGIQPSHGPERTALVRSSLRVKSVNSNVS